MSYQQKEITTKLSVKIIIAIYENDEQEFYQKTSINDFLAGRLDTVIKALEDGSYVAGVLFENGTTHRCGHGNLIADKKEKIIAELKNLKTDCMVRIFIYGKPEEVYIGFELPDESI